MPAQNRPACPHRPAVESLAHDALPDEQRPAEQAHLERCESCRAIFRRITAGWFPHVKNYTIIEQVGRGGFGVVYKAVHHHKQRIEALKVHLGKTPLRATYFENEVHLIARLRHPNIATLYEANLGGEPPYYAMEFIEGRQLGEYLQSRDVTLEERIRLLKAVASAIGYAHEQGVVHRDIKPPNILVDAQGNPRIVDFGIGKKLGLGEADDAPPGETTRAEGAIGTFGYIAPEQLSGRPVDSRADIYALGALLYHCITGEPARFVHRPERIASVLRQRRVSRSDDLAAIVLRCVAHDPAERYQNCQALIADLDNYMETRAITARADRPPGYHAVRAAANALRYHPFALRAALVAGFALLLTQLLWALDSRYFAPAESDGQTMLVGFSESTLTALERGQIGGDLPGLGAANLKSWRLLHGRLLEKLALGRPRVVLMDYYFPDCRPEFDEGFIRSIEALGAPVVVGAKFFDVNGEPQICPAIRAAVHSVGTLGTPPPSTRSGEYVVTLALARGFETPIPSLALAAYAAARHPDSQPQPVIQAGGLELRYRRRQARADQPQWRAETDTIALLDVTAHAKDEVFRSGDQIAHGSVRKVGAEFWRPRLVHYEDVLTADDSQLRRWFEGKAVVIGQMIPGQDQYREPDGSVVFGCQVHALSIQGLFDRALLHRLYPPELALRALAACLLAIAGALALRPLLRVLPLGRLATASAIIFGLGLAVTFATGAACTTRWQVELGIALGALATTGGVALLLEGLRERQLRLAPGPTWSSEEATLSSTLLADTR